ncbi:MAG: hypothetical protein M5T61_00555 [Acidimicrobiia bacterium]|nr:hypothetical protein [Acidimicrobiia bacterium]
MPVVAAEGLVGRVIEVWSSGAKVLLLTDSRSGVSVRMVRPRLTGQAHGRAGRSTLVLDLVEPIKGTPAARCDQHDHDQHDHDQQPGAPRDGLDRHNRCRGGSGGHDDHDDDRRDRRRGLRRGRR